MDRRTVLAAVSLSVTPAFSGCTGALSGCSEPDIEIPLTYENHRVVDDNVYNETGVAKLVTSPDDIDDDLEEAMDEEAIDYIMETDFDESVIVVVQVVSSVGSDELEILGVGREEEATVRTYTCVPDESGTDDLYPRTQVIRIEHEGKVPVRAIGTHSREDTEVTINGDG